MEEQKKESKTVRMDTGNAQEAKQLSYEKLNEVCIELSKQNRQMEEYIQKCHRQMHQMEGVLQTRRLDYLFKVMELSKCRSVTYNFSDDFVQKCVQEIEEALTIPEQEEDARKED